MAYFESRFFYLLIVFLNILSINAFAQGTPGVTAGGSGNDVGLSICAAHDGGYVVAGSTRSRGAGSNDFYFVILNANGQITGDKTYGWAHQDFFRGIIPIDNGYAFIGDSWSLGYGRLDIYMLKTDRFGNNEKGFSYGYDMRDNGFDIMQTDDGGFAILGHARHDNPYGNIVLIKTDSEGNLLWDQEFSGEGNDYAFQITNSSNNDGYVFVGSKDGFFDDVHADFKAHDADILLIKTDEEGNQIWKKYYGESGHDFGYGICNAPDGGYYIIGSSQSYGNGSFDMLLLKTDEDGNEEWIKSFGGPDYEYGKSIITDNEGNLYLIGSSKSFGTENSVDVFIVKTDADGNELWSETFGGPKNDFGEDAVIRPDGGCMIVGSTNSFGSGGSDVYLLGIKSNGEPDMFEDIDSKPELPVVFYPNPMSVSGVFAMPYDSSGSNYTILLYDSFGRMMLKETIRTNRFNLQKGNLISGTYYYRIISEKDPGIFYNGKIVIR